MRPLNRPMFRYGGPIKEGVMSGIREPKKNGGSMREAQQWNTVGSPVFPKDSSGRAHHVAPAVWGIGAGLARVLPWAARGAKAAWRFMKPTSIPRNIYTKSKSTLPIGMRGTIGSRTTTTPRSNWQMSKEWMKANPGYTITGGLGVYNAPSTYEGIKGGVGVGGKVLKQIADLAVPDWIWDQDKWEKERAEKKKPPRSTGGNTVGPQHPSNNPDLYGGLKTAEDAAKAKLAAEKLRKDRIQKYRDIVDIKGMNKEAAAKSLIEASRLINESQDFKGDIRSGKLINRIIQGTSKAYDKPADMRRAIDTLILKGEIQKDIAGAKGTAAFQAIDALASASGKSHKYVANQKLGIPNTVGEAVAQLKKIKGLQTTSDDVATQVYSFSEQSGVPVQKHITTEQKNELIGKDKKYSSLTEMISKEKFTEDGYYIIGTSVFEVVGGVPRIKG